MNSTPDIQGNLKRDATASIRGYVYQVYQSVLAWMELKPDEVLRLECAEDFEICHNSSVISTQVKDVSENLTLRSQAIIETLNNFWSLQKDNPSHNIVLRFLTTAASGYEQGAPFGQHQKGLEFWQTCSTHENTVEILRKFLLTLSLSTDLRQFIELATWRDLVSKLILRIRWDLSNKPKEALEFVIEKKLMVHGAKFGINTHHSTQALSHLVKRMADILSTKGNKRLEYADFLSAFDDATTESVPRGQLAAMRSNSDLNQLLGTINAAEITRLNNQVATINNPPPVVNGAIARSSLVTQLEHTLHSCRVLFMHGSSGLGKTNLAVLVTKRFDVRWGWASFRSRTNEQIKDMLARAVIEISNQKSPSFLVLDDLPLDQSWQYESELITLVFSITQHMGMVIITSQARPPLQLLLKLWLPPLCEQAIPYFDGNEIIDLIQAHGLEDSAIISDWARAVFLTTSGHPQLAHARVKTLSAKNWPPISKNDFSTPEDIERIRSEARKRLVQDFPTDTTRRLAYRLSLVTGTFSRATGIAIAEAPPPADLPGEIFDTLVGPWIEKEGEDRFRVSPLLLGAAENVLPKAEIFAIHSAICSHLLSQKILNQFEVGTAFFHAYMSKSISALGSLAYKIVLHDSDSLGLLYDAMFWFPSMALEKGQCLIDEKAPLELMLRIAQFKLACASSQMENALPIVDRILETIGNLDNGIEKDLSEMMAYSTLLNTLEIPISSSKVIKMISRIIDITATNNLVENIKEIEGMSLIDAPLLGDNKLSQILFSYQAVRVIDLNDLVELIKSLDELPKEKRNELLKVCESNFDFANLLINRAWWKDVNDGTLNTTKALQVFKYSIEKATEWDSQELIKTCMVAISVILDEYDKDKTQALAVLNEADILFPNDAPLFNQRAKVFFHAKSYREALYYFYKALAQPGLSDIDFILSCRSAGIASVRLNNDWRKTALYFLRGARKSKKLENQKALGIGLLADAATALWYQKKFTNSLKAFSIVLTLLTDLQPDENIHNHHVHATVRHCITWIHFQATNRKSTSLENPLPGMCSNQEPHEKIVDHRLFDIRGSWGLLAATERFLGLNAGIANRTLAATQGQLPTIIAVYERGVELFHTLKSGQLGKLIPKIVETHEALHFSKLNKTMEDQWRLGFLPNLPKNYWDDGDSWDLTNQVILSACVNAIAHTPPLPLPIDVWRQDMSKITPLSATFDKLLNVLEGAAPDESYLQKAAAGLICLRDQITEPNELWRISFYLICTLRSSGELAELPLEVVLLKHWIFAVKNQRFLFRTPDIATTDIELACMSPTYQGISKLAYVLETASAYLSMEVATNVKEFLRDLQKETSTNII